MGCPIEIHQFITTWKNNLPQQSFYNNNWIHNTEKQYFGFIPKDSTALILGTFPVPEQRTSGFFYHSDVNLFWKILSIISNYDLITLNDKLSWLVNNRIAISDILYKAQRTDEKCIGRADSDLNPISYNNILQILNDYPSITNIFLTSGGPKSKSLTGKSAGGWLGTYFRNITRNNIKKINADKATLTIQLKPSLKHYKLHYLITPAPQDDQLGKYLRNNLLAKQTLNEIIFLKDVVNPKEKYKCFQWAVYLSNLPGIVGETVRQQITSVNIDKILMESKA